jgi:hypothetical protein
MPIRLQGDATLDAADNTREPHVKRVTPAAPSDEISLHVCGECGSAMVYPTDWEEAGPDHWDVELRCPNCEWRGTGVFHQDVVEAFDDELDRGIDVLLADYRALVSSNMEDEIERFAKALDVGAILPADF